MRITAATQLTAALNPEMQTLRVFFMRAESTGVRTLGRFGRLSERAEPVAAFMWLTRLGFTW